MSEAETKAAVGPSGKLYNLMIEPVAAFWLRVEAEGRREQMDALTERHGLWRHWNEGGHEGKKGFYTYDSTQIQPLAKLLDMKREGAK